MAALSYFPNSKKHGRQVLSSLCMGSILAAAMLQKPMGSEHTWL